MDDELEKMLHEFRLICARPTKGLSELAALFNESEEYKEKILAYYARACERCFEDGQNTF